MLKLSFPSKASIAVALRLFGMASAVAETGADEDNSWTLVAGKDGGGSRRRRSGAGGEGRPGSHGRASVVHRCDLGDVGVQVVVTDAWKEPLQYRILQDGSPSDSVLALEFNAALCCSNVAAQPVELRLRHCGGPSSSNPTPTDSMRAFSRPLPSN